MPEKFNLRLPISKLDSDKGTVTGWAALSTVNDQLIIDHHNEVVPIEELNAAAQALVRDGGEGKAGNMHAFRAGDIVESMVFDKEKAQALGLGDGSVEGWAVTMKINDPATIEQVKSGALKEMSIHGLAKKAVVGERDGQVIKALSGMQIDEVSVVDEGASGDDKSAPKIVIAKRKTVFSKLKEYFQKQEQAKMTLEEILAKMPEEDRNVILAALESLKAPVAAPVAPVAVEPVVNADPAPVAPAPVEKEEEPKDEMAKAKKDHPVLFQKLKDLEEKEEKREFIAKARALNCIPGMSTEDRAEMLRAVSKGCDKATFEKIEKSLNAAAVVAKNSELFKVVGSTADGDSSAEGELKSIAKSKEISISEAAKQNPELYERYRAEMKEG